MAEDTDGEDNEEEEPEAPAVELGEAEPVEGAPLARVASRLTWPLERTRVAEKEGGTVIRTPDGPRELADVLEEVDVSYFERRQEFVTAVEDVIGVGPIPTGGTGDGGETDGNSDGVGAK